MELKQIIFDSPEYARMVDLRCRILRRPLGERLEREEQMLDEDAYLLGCFDGAGVVGCLVLHKYDGEWIKMRQVAVEAAAQGAGIGRKMLHAAYDAAHGWGYRRMFCHARETARGFYLKEGWEVKGGTFLENTVPHCRMEYGLE